MLKILAGYESGRYSGQSLCPLYHPANIYLLLRLYYARTLHSKQYNPARNSNSSNVRNRPWPESFSPAIYFIRACFLRYKHNLFLDQTISTVLEEGNQYDSNNTSSSSDQDFSLSYNGTSNGTKYNNHARP
jgi:hypothetical protein